MKPMVPVTATAPPTPSATPEITNSRKRPTSTPRLCAVSSPRTQRTKGMALAEQHDRAGNDERQRKEDVLKAAVLQRAEQPERDLQHQEGIGGEVHHQRGGSARKARNRQACENKDQKPGIAAGDREQHENGRERRDDGRDRQCDRSAHRPAPARSPAPRRRRPIAARRTGRARPADCATGPAATRRTAREWRRSPAPAAFAAAGFPAR